jgi:hypothetical protein
MRPRSLLLVVAALIAGSSVQANNDSWPPTDEHGNLTLYRMPPKTDAEWKAQKLYFAYRIYYVIKACHEVRDGFAVVYINDVQMEKARFKIKDIEDDAVAAKPGLDTDGMWKEAIDNAHGYPLNFEPCQNYLKQLFGMKSSHPVDRRGVKDF